MPLSAREQRQLAEGLRTLRRRATMRMENEQRSLRLVEDLLALIERDSDPMPLASHSLVLNRARVGTKSWKIGQLLLRPQGCTAPEAMRTVGWPSVSMVQQARICGLQLVREGAGRNIRFRARPVMDNPT